jgi:hypothetical protein
MANQTLPLWEDGELLLPQRSRLFHLKLEGKGVQDQEALLGYAHRVANAHVVPIVKLLREEVLGRTDMRSAWFTSGFSKKYSKTINGYGKYAVEMSAALESLTLNEDLRSGTFLYWRGLFDGKGTGLLHPKRRWCSNCLIEDDNAQRPITYRLLWASYLVDHCPTHLTPLRSDCPSCGMEQLFVSDAVALGRCCHCGAFLGVREGLWDCPAPGPKDKFMVAAISEMISMGPGAEDLALIEKFIAQIKAFSLRVVEGPVSKLEREIGFRKGSIYRWTAGGKKPQFDQFLELCFRINVSPADLLTGSWANSPSPRAIRKMDVPVRQHHKVLSEAGLAALREDVDRLSSCFSSYEDAKDVAARHGITMTSFTNRYAEIYAKFSQHRIHVRELLRLQRLRTDEEKTKEVMRQLHRNGMRLVRAAIEPRMKEAGLSLRSPRLRAIAFAERARLEGSGVATLAPVGKQRASSGAE